MTDEPPRKEHDEPKSIHTDHPTSPPHPLDRVINRSRGLGPGGYIWILNVAKVDGDSVTLAPGCLLRRATQGEVNDLRTLLDHFRARTVPRNPWEVEAIIHPGDTPEEYTIALSPLPPDTLRYHVLHYDQPSNITAHRLCTASVLGKGLYFDLGYSVTRAGELAGGGYVPPGVGSSRTLDRLLSGMLTMSEDYYFSSVSSADAEDLAQTFARLDAARMDGDAQVVEDAAAAFLSVMEITHAEMRLLGLFTILESILTHKPNKDDPHQSIIRQIQNKMTLVSNRMIRPVDVAARLGSTPKTATLWKSLYELRSAIAHGSHPQFTGALTLLKDQKTAEALVVESVRSLLRQLLWEPMLMRDLRDC